MGGVEDGENSCGGDGGIDDDGDMRTLQITIPPYSCIHA
jgi:hypothetical protein